MLGNSRANKKDRKSEIVSRWYKEYFNMLLKNSYNIVKDDELAEDMVHNTFVKVINNFQKINNLSDNARAAYIIGINKNVCLDYLRKQIVEMDHIEELYSDKLTSDENFIGIDSFSNVEILMDLEKNLGKLEERDRNLILGKYVWNMCDEEIGELVNIKPQNVHTYLSRAIKKLMRIDREEVQTDE